jgi:hypothetical protein
MLGYMRKQRIIFFLFYGGLRTEIQDLVDYKEYNTINHLFLLVILAKKESQGRQLMKSKNSFPSHLASTAPSMTA